MVGFYCGTQFHILESIFLKRMYFQKEEAVMFIVSPLEISSYDLEELVELGFSEVVDVTSKEPVCDTKFDRVFFFSLFTHHSEYLKCLRKSRLSLAYDGITTFMLKHWATTDVNKTFNIDADIDEIWVPTKDLMLDEEYKEKCITFDFGLEHLTDEELMRLCEGMNKVFRYEYSPITSSTVYMDRYLTKFSNVFFDVTIEKFLTQAIYYSYNKHMSIKRHPYDVYYKEKYSGLEDAQIIESDAPWELLFLNSYVRQKNDMPNTYIVYNSFAPANITLLFGNRDFKVVCVQPILDNYSQLDNTYLNVDITLEIFKKFSALYQIELFVAESFSDLKKKENIGKHVSLNEIWKNLIVSVSDNDYIDVKSLLAFRLFLEGIIEFKDSTSLRYFINRETDGGAEMISLLSSTIENAGYKLKQTNQRDVADLVIEVNTNFSEYAMDDYDIRKGKKAVISVANVLKKEILLKKIQKKKNLYIWGATASSDETIELISRHGFLENLRCIFDGGMSGEKLGIPIMKFDRNSVEVDSMIIVCAKLAYREIEHILIENGFVLDKDYVFGIGIG